MRHKELYFIKDMIILPEMGILKLLKYFQNIIDQYGKYIMDKV